eukprot:7010463-Pyramimonas_sp.AAC.1
MVIRDVCAVQQGQGDSQRPCYALDLPHCYLCQAVAGAVVGGRLLGHVLELQIPEADRRLWLERHQGTLTIRLVDDLRVAGRLNLTEGADH